MAMVQVQLRARGIRDERVLAAMEQVPRHLFVAREFQADAYGDFPVPIGHGQTISQPLIVALMLEAAGIRPEHVVLEVGTGSGYEAALVAELAARVYTIERLAALAAQARKNLLALGYERVAVSVGDGSQGLPDAAPFDAIIVSAAAPQVPPSLFQQLREGGRLVVPVGVPESQELKLVRKHDGKPVITWLESCRFVPLVGAEGFEPGW
jgi:protein-L-isoaspartate(D-aspartate) O-methyltransferase